MFGRKNVPSHAELMDSRDTVIARHTNLRIVGAHLGSHEHDLKELALRLDRFPNFAVDISARLPDLARHDTAEVREFCVRYQDRILFGTDHGARDRFSRMPAEESRRELRDLADRLNEHFQFFASAEKLSVGGYCTQGLALPPDVVERILRTNAQTWYPGI